MYRSSQRFPFNPKINYNRELTIKNIAYSVLLSWAQEEFSENLSRHFTYRFHRFFRNFYQYGVRCSKVSFFFFLKISQESLDETKYGRCEERSAKCRMEGNLFLFIETSQAIIMNEANHRVHTRVSAFQVRLGSGRTAVTSVKLHKTATRNDTLIQFAWGRDDGRTCIVIQI